MRLVNNFNIFETEIIHHYKWFFNLKENTIYTNKVPCGLPIVVGCYYKAYSIQQDEMAQSLMAKKQKDNHATEDTASC